MVGCETYGGLHLAMLMRSGDLSYQKVGKDCSDPSMHLEGFVGDIIRAQSLFAAPQHYADHCQPRMEATPVSPSHHICQFAMFFRKCSLTDDRKFGPLVECEEFDFTLQFEQSILVIGVSALFLISMLLRVKKLFGQEEESFATRIYPAKLVRSGLLALKPWLTQFRRSRQSMLLFRLHPSYSGRSIR
jgi:hypothetical protein